MEEHVGRIPHGNMANYSEDLLRENWIGKISEAVDNSINSEDVGSCLEYVRIQEWNPAR
jgi:hypothetical protein